MAFFFISEIFAIFIFHTSIAGTLSASCLVSAPTIHHSHQKPRYSEFLTRLIFVWINQKLLTLLIFSPVRAVRAGGQYGDYKVSYQSWNCTEEWSATTDLLIQSTMHIFKILIKFYCQRYKRNNPCLTFKNREISNPAVNLCNYRVIFGSCKIVGA